MLVLPLVPFAALGVAAWSDRRAATTRARFGIGPVALAIPAAAGVAGWEALQALGGITAGTALFYVLLEAARDARFALASSSAEPWADPAVIEPELRAAVAAAAATGVSLDKDCAWVLSTRATAMRLFDEIGHVAQARFLARAFVGTRIATRGDLLVVLRGAWTAASRAFGPARARLWEALVGTRVGSILPTLGGQVVLEGITFLCLLVTEVLGAGVSREVLAEALRRVTDHMDLCITVSRWTASYDTLRQLGRDTVDLLRDLPSLAGFLADRLVIPAGIFLGLAAATVSARGPQDVIEGILSLARAWDQFAHDAARGSSPAPVPG